MHVIGRWQLFWVDNIFQNARHRTLTTIFRLIMFIYVHDIWHWQLFWVDNIFQGARHRILTTILGWWYFSKCTHIAGRPPRLQSALINATFSDILPRCKRRTTWVINRSARCLIHNFCQNKMLWHPLQCWFSILHQVPVLKNDVRMTREEKKNSGLKNSSTPLHNV